MTDQPVQKQATAAQIKAVEHEVRALIDASGYGWAVGDDLIANASPKIANACVAAETTNQLGKDYNV